MHYALVLFVNMGCLLILLSLINVYDAFVIVIKLITSYFF